MKYVGSVARNTWYVQLCSSSVRTWAFYLQAIDSLGALHPLISWRLILLHDLHWKSERQSNNKLMCSYYRKDTAGGYRCDVTQTFNARAKKSHTASAKNNEKNTTCTQLHCLCAATANQCHRRPPKQQPMVVAVASGHSFIVLIFYDMFY